VRCGTASFFRTLQTAIQFGVALILSGCFVTVEPVFTPANSIEPGASPEFQSFLRAAQRVAENIVEGEIYANVPLGNPPIDLRVVSVPGTDLVLVQESLEGLGECATTGCYIYYGVRVSEGERPERCNIKLGYLETEGDEAPITQAARHHNVELTPLVDNRRVRGYGVSGSKGDIFSFLIEQFSRGPYDCSMPAITGGSGVERLRR